MAVVKIYKGSIVRDDIVKIYKGNELIYEAGPIYPSNVVVFKSDSPRTITPKYTNTGITLQYSIDSGTTWVTIASGVTTPSSNEIWFRGRATGTKRLFTSSTTSNAWTFGGDGINKLKVYGNLNFLLCNTLGDEVAPTGLSSYCYNNMFRDCTALTTAPSLPATTLADSCYGNMFRGCTSLTKAPELPATTLADSCYGNMFYDCTSLTTSPELPATRLANYCYFAMFQNCTSLTTVPKLPATTLVDYCYYRMFMGCSSFKVSQTETGSYQYAWRISASYTTATQWNKEMLKDTGGTFTSDPTINRTYYVQNPPV